MILGKIIGMLLGYLVGGPLGLVVGLFIGGMLDRAPGQKNTKAKRSLHSHIEQELFAGTFLLLGHLSKADGRINEQEIYHTEYLIKEMGLSPNQRNEAIRLFNEGAETSFNPNDTINRLYRICGKYPNYAQLLVIYLVNIALSDGRFTFREEEIIKNIAIGLGVTNYGFEQLISMVKAQNTFQRGGERDKEEVDETVFSNLDLAYQAIGVSEDLSNAQLKRAYRKLASQYHPDKLQGRGLPARLIKDATLRSQEIHAAYDIIRKARGL